MTRSLAEARRPKPEAALILTLPSPPPALPCPVASPIPAAWPAADQPYSAYRGSWATSCSHKTVPSALRLYRALEVGTGVEILAANLFGGHVGHGAEGGAGAGEVIGIYAD